MVFKVRSFQLCVCVSCLWGPGMKPTATASSDLMQKAAGSSTIYHSLCVPRLSPSSVIMVSPVTKHFVTLGWKKHDGGWGVVGVQECHLHRWTVAGYAVDRATCHRSRTLVLAYISELIDISWLWQYELLDILGNALSPFFAETWMTRLLSLSCLHSKY